MKDLLTKLLLLIGLVTGSSNAWADTYSLLTSAPVDWSGDYVLATVVGDAVHSWTGVDAGQCHVAATIVEGKISDPSITITVAALTGGGYSVRVNGGVNDGKYLSSGTSAPTYSNGLKFVANPHRVDFGMDANGSVEMSQTISNSGKMFLLYNKNSGSSNERFRFYKDTNLGGSNYLTPKLYKKDASGSSTPSAKSPNLTSSANWTGSSFDVTITNNEDGSTVYYTTDGTDPTTSTPTSFTSASQIVPITQTTTVKAMSVVAGKDNSSIASATYTYLAPYTTFASAFTVATGNAVPAAFSFENVVVTAATSKNAYLQDESGNVALIYNSSAHGFTQGQALTGTVLCSIQRYNGVLEFTNLTSSTPGISTSAGSPVAVNKTLSEVSESNYGELVTISNLVYDGATKTFKDGSKSITPYTTFMDPLPSFENGATYSVTGIVLVYKSTLEISPRAAGDIVKTADASKSSAILSATYEASLTVGDADDVYDVTYDGDGTLTVSSSVPSVATATLEGSTVTIHPLVAGTTMITINATEGTNYYAAQLQYTLTVNAALVAAALPFEFDGGRNDIANTTGMSQTGLDTDYSSSPKLKFDGTGDNVIIFFNEAAKSLNYTIKGNSFSGGTFDVMESADGSNYTAVHQYTELVDAVDESYSLNEASRYVKFVYTIKDGGNVALGAISIRSASEPEDSELAYSWDGNQNSSKESANEEGGTATVVGSTTNVVGKASKLNWCLSLGKGYSNGANFIKITLDQPLKGGETITTGCFVTGNTKPTTDLVYGISFGGENELTLTYDADDEVASEIEYFNTNKAPEDTQLVVPAAAAGANEIWIYRKSGSTTLYVSKFVVELATGDALDVKESTWATFCNANKVAVPSASVAKLYKVTRIEADVITLSQLSEGTVIPANTGLIVNAPAKTVVLKYSSEIAADMSDNILVGLDADKTAASDEEMLVLAKLSNGNVGFAYLSSGATLEAGKAYIPGSAVTSGVSSFRLVIEGAEGNETGINQIETVTDNGASFDLQGRRAQGKGLLIQNGKVVLVK